MRKRAFYLIFTFPLLWAGCSPEPVVQEGTGLIPGKGGIFYGGVFRYNEREHYETLFPPLIELAVTQRTAAQIFEGLVKLDQEDLDVKPAIAKSWKIDSTGKVYTFRIREGVRFHDSECFKGGNGRMVTAMDFKRCFENMASSDLPNAGYDKLLKDKIVGANEFHDGKAEEIIGIKAVDDQTLEVQLVEPLSTFLYLLSTPFCYLYPMEAYEKYGKGLYVGTGPFMVETVNETKELILMKNSHYYLEDEHGNKIPYLDGIVVTFIEDSDSVVAEFKRGNHHLIYQLPTDYIINVMEYGTEKFLEYKNDGQTEMLVQYYEFQNQSGIFTDKRVRNAFSYAINRELIVDKILQGDGVAGLHGITPPCEFFSDYKVDSIIGYNLDVEKARKLLAEAGYPGGKGFPEIVLDVNEGVGRINVLIAEEVKTQLKENLDVNMSINELSFPEKNLKARKGESMMWRSGWRSDYPHPESFLSLFYGRDVPSDTSSESYPNTSRYVNPLFDEYYEKGLHSRTLREGYPWFRKAEQIAMMDAPVLIISYSENYRITQPEIANFPNNAMQYRDFSTVYFMQETQQEKPSDQTSVH